MTARHRKSRDALPALWLMTDERIDERDLVQAVARLPRGAGIIFRHYRIPSAARRALFERVRTIARARRLVLLLAGSAKQAAAWQADGWHGAARAMSVRPMIRSAPVHSLPQIRRAERTGADILFLSPVFPTRSHAGAPTLGRVRFADLARQARQPVIALGGMTAARARSLCRAGIHGWAAIDALSGSSGRARASS
jgi:thiamine-phosphate pyrophosphorylase